MLCSDCKRTARPDTLIGGSDALELIGWLCFLLPGLVYCYWRHLDRIKVCSFCGGTGLVREAKAARKPPEVGVPAPPPQRIHYSAERLRWPRWLASPRLRLRRGSLVTGAFSVFFVGWVFAATNLLDYRPAPRPTRRAPPTQQASAPAESELSEPVSETLNKHRSCWERCSDFHGFDGVELVPCVNKCLEEERRAEPSLAAAQCAGILDEAACRAFIGR
jgi:hypothetical protein